MDSEHRDQIIAIWKSIVEVQIHFNEIAMRIRSIFVTSLLATFAAMGFLLNNELRVNVLGCDILFATFVPLFGIVATCLFYFMDRYWYHRLLAGSVNQAVTIEEKYKNELPELSLSKAIGKESPYEPRHIVYCVARLLVRHERFRETGKLHSEGKIELFYKSVILVLFLTMVVTVLFD